MTTSNFDKTTFDLDALEDRVTRRILKASEMAISVFPSFKRSHLANAIEQLPLLELDALIQRLREAEAERDRLSHWASIYRIKRLEGIRDAAQEFHLAHEFWLTVPEGPHHDPEVLANASGAMDGAHQRLGIALAELKK